MTTPRPRGTTRLLAGLATTALLGAGFACVATPPASADTTSSPLGFSVTGLAATPDGDVVTVGYTYDDETETEHAHAAVVRDGEVVPIEGVPADVWLAGVAVTDSDTDGTSAIIGGTDDNGAAVWSVDLSADAPIAESAVAPEWNRITAVSSGDVPLVAGTAWDEGYNEYAVVTRSTGAALLVQDGTPTAAATDADGTSYVAGTRWDGENGERGELWVTDGAEVDTYDVGGYPSALVAAGETALVATNVEGDGQGEGIVRAIDTAAGTTAASLAFGSDTRVQGMALSADATTVYVAVSDYTSWQFKIHAVPVDGFAAYDVTTDAAVDAGSPLGALTAIERDGLTTVFSSQYDGTTESDAIAGFDIYGELVAPDATASIVGTTAVVGQTLTGQTSGWPEGTELTYSWSISGGEWGDGRDGQSLTLSSDWMGAQVRYRVTGVKQGDKLMVESAPIRVTAAPATPVTKLPALPVTKKAVAKLAGKAKVGQKIKAKVGTWPKGTKIKVQWLKNGKPIKGATKKKLKLTKKLKGKKVSVVVTGIKPGYAPKVKKSKAAKVR